MKQTENILLWLIETRCPDIWKKVQSRLPRTVEGDPLLQAKTLAMEYEIEKEDAGVDEDALYKLYMDEKI